MENIRLRSAKNIRDLGGIKTMDGRSVRHCRFLRGDSISNLTPGDIAILTDRYKLKEVIDLRSLTEQAEKPDKIIDGVTYHSISIDEDTSGGIPTDSDPAISDPEADSGPVTDGLPEIYHQYAGLVRNSFSVSQLKKVMHTIIDARDSGGSVLFHCFLGKDRTGLAAMLLLSLLGVSRENIVADYSFTPTRYRYAVKWYIIILFREKSFRAAREFYREFLADPSYINYAYDAVVSDYGSVENFLRTSLDISDELREEFRNASLE